MFGFISKIKSRFVKRRFKFCGANVTISTESMFAYPENIFISDHVYIGPQALIVGKGGLWVGSNVIIGPRVTIHTSNHRYGKGATMLPYDGYTHLKPVKINQNTWIGSNVCICPGVVIGEGVVIGMGSVVTKNIPDYAIVGGNPAKILRYRDKNSYDELAGQRKRYLELKAIGKVVWHDYE